MSKVAIIIRAIVIVSSLVLLVGCSSKKSTKNCNKPREYHAAGSIDALRVPSDLDAPNPAIGLKIPDALPDEPSPEELYAEGSPCLEAPPDFFDTSTD